VSVSDLLGQAFFHSGIDNISAILIEDGTANFTISGYCMADVNGVRLICDFGSSDNVTVSGDIEILGSGFCNNINLTNLSFAPDSKLSHILDRAFYEGESLRSIVIPASVTTISGTAFCFCHLETVIV
jgi:hypothetical protein